MKMEKKYLFVNIVKKNFLKKKLMEVMYEKCILNQIKNKLKKNNFSHNNKHKFLLNNNRYNKYIRCSKNDF